MVDSSPKAKSYHLQIAIHLNLRSIGPKNYLENMFLRIGRQTHILLPRLTHSRPMPLISSRVEMVTQFKVLMNCHFAWGAELYVWDTLGSYWKTVGWGFTFGKVCGNFCLHKQPRSPNNQSLILSRYQVMQQTDLLILLRIKYYSMRSRAYKQYLKGSAVPSGKYKTKLSRVGHLQVQRKEER